MTKGYLRSDRMGRDERARVVANLFHEGRRRTPFQHRFAALMILSSLIAVLGLLADSTAVVIGAMIVAPLMAPVLGVAAALVMDWPRRAARSATTAAAGSVICIVLAALTGLVLPSADEIPGEIMARTAPNLLDLGVAVSAGAAGAYAQVRKAAGEALTGVAVAVALVPPLAVVGLTLQMGEWTLAAGAVLLFVANVAGIVLSAAATFMVCGLVPQRRLFTGRIHVARSMRLAMAAVLLILAPLELTDQWRERRPINEEETRAAVKEVLQVSNPGAAVIAIEVDSDDGERTIDITASTSEDPIDVGELAAELSNELDVSFKLEVTSIQAVSQKAKVAEAETAEDEPTVAVEPTMESIDEMESGRLNTARGVSEGVMRAKVYNPWTPTGEEPGSALTSEAGSSDDSTPDASDADLSDRPALDADASDGPPSDGPSSDVSLDTEAYDGPPSATAPRNTGASDTEANDGTASDTEPSDTEPSETGASDTEPSDTETSGAALSEAGASADAEALPQSLRKAGNSSLESASRYGITAGAITSIGQSED